MKELKRRLHFVWKNVTLETLEELAHSMPRCLENVKMFLQKLLVNTKLTIIL